MASLIELLKISIADDGFVFSVAGGGTVICFTLAVFSEI